tara:strand:- start:231 stop:704 length:474 start_codon:yes stop_codon:yes gene_type:complete
MKNFNEKDIKILDYIINNSNSITGIGVKELIEADFLNNIDEKGYGTLIVGEYAKEEFKRLMAIIESYDCGKCIFEGPFAESGRDHININHKTSHFKYEGGFENAYKELVNREKKEKLVQRNLEFSIKLNELQVKYNWLPYVLSIVSVIISVIAIIYS